MWHACIYVRSGGWGGHYSLVLWAVSGKHLIRSSPPANSNMYVLCVLSLSVLSNSLRPYGLQPPGSSVRGDSPGRKTGVGSCFLLQEIFPTQGLNPGLLQCRQILYQLSHQGSPRILEWRAYPFSRASSWPRNQTGVSCIAGRFFTVWATREAQTPRYLMAKKTTKKKKNTQPTNKHTVPGVLYNIKQRDWFLHSDEVKP